MDKLASILSGEKPIYLNLQFLIRNDKTDPLILKQTKVELDPNLWINLVFKRMQCESRSATLQL